MKKNNISFPVNELVSTIIKDHYNKKLGTCNMLDYIQDKYSNISKSIIIDNILTIGDILASMGYEIKIDIDKFDIVNYNSDEYKKYLMELNKKI